MMKFGSIYYAGNMLIRHLCEHMPLSGAQVKYGKNTDKKWAKIQKKYRKIY